MEENMEDQNQEVEEEKEVEVTEVSLDENEIDELIAKLQLLKATKEPVSFELDEETELMIHLDGEANGEAGEEGE